MNNIPIFLASDENYAPYLCTTIYSILQNTDSFIDFYVLDNKIQQNTKQMIADSLSDFNNYSIKYIDVSNLGLDRFPNLKHYSVNTFSRYFIPELVADLDKVLYIDVDTIIKGDIKNLYDIELDNNYAGVVIEDFLKKSGINLQQNIYKKYKNPLNYFCAGVMLMNTKRMREENISEKLVEKTIELADILVYPDQDVLNIIFEENVKILDYVYNYYPDGYRYYAQEFGKVKAQEIKNNAVILHYTGGKPWFRLSCANDEFWNIVHKTKFTKVVENTYRAYRKRTFWQRFIKNIFSIKNDYDDCGNKRKVIKILGIKIKVKKFPNSLFVDFFKKKYPNYISLGIIIKDEANYIKEWIEYHRLIGVEKFYIYDDNSTDNIKEVLKPYIDKGIVDYKACLTNVINRQVEAYNDIINQCKYQTRWIGFIDVDEFIVPIEKDNLKDFLKSYEKYSGLGINWMCFDSNGHKKRPEGLVIENYTRIHKKRDLFVEEYHLKCIVNPRLVRYAEVHNCEFYKGHHVDEDMKPITSQQFPQGHFLEDWNSSYHPHLRVICEAKKIIINHYWSKSEEEYKQRIEKNYATHEDKRPYEEERLNFSEYAFNTHIIDKYLDNLKNNMNKEV